MSDIRPDILLVMPDQMRADCLGLAGHQVLSTPIIDRIGRQGCHFRRAYSSCPSCIPARRSLLTGQFPATHGSVGFKVEPYTTATLPGLLTEAGYATHLVGRNMHQNADDENPGYEQCRLGSTYVEGDDYARALQEAHPALGGIRGLGIDFNGWQVRPWPLPEEWHPSHWVAQESRRVIADHDRQRPLFLTTSFYGPHPPLLPTPFHYQRYLDRDLPPRHLGDWASPEGCGHDVDSPRIDLHGPALQMCRAAYYGMINQIDDQLTWLVKEFMAMSRAAGRPWVIVFTSDHGEMLGDHYYYRKCEPFEGSAAIPLLIASGGLGQEAGLSDDVPVCLEDILPTLLDFAGLEIPDTIDGISLVPSLRGQTPRAPRLLHSEHAPCYSRPQAFQMLTDGRHKYIWRPCTGQELFFDLTADPGECHDHSRTEAYSAAVATMRGQLIERLAGRPEGFVRDGRLTCLPEGYPPIMATKGGDRRGDDPKCKIGG